jgi:hypothetical protein
MMTKGFDEDSKVTHLDLGETKKPVTQPTFKKSKKKLEDHAVCGVACVVFVHSAAATP